MKLSLRITIVGVAAVLFAVGGEACSHTDALDFAPIDGSSGAFSVDGSLDSAPPDSGLLEYCPALHCPFPWATCASSKFPCDVNLLTDSANCGTCEFDCNANGGGYDLGASYSCSSGMCKASCEQGRADCNGIVDDGCETRIGTNAACNGCGDTCPDPAKPCIYDTTIMKGTCGCAAGLTLCDGNCVDLTSDDGNCNACDHACPATGDAGVLKAHEYLGCSDSACGAIKCEQGFADCDGNPNNGCEANLVSDEHCGACATACDPGTTCKIDYTTKPHCLCPPGKTLCGNVCTDIQTDPQNCGACGIDCAIQTVDKHTTGICKYGSCQVQCVLGWGDCNGDPKDGCEVNLGSDQNNCGACGNACDVFGGQPCIIGQCAVEPCGEAGVPR